MEGVADVLISSLEEERQAVFGFLFTFFDEVSAWLLPCCCRCLSPTCTDKLPTCADPDDPPGVQLRRGDLPLGTRCDAPQPGPLVDDTVQGCSP